MRHARPVGAFGLTLLIGCAASPTDLTPVSPVAVSVESLRDPEAQELASKVAFLSGYDQIEDVAQLNFRFVYFDGEKRLFEAHHHWDLENRRDRIVWTDAEGHSFDAVVDTQQKVVYGFIDGEEAVGDDLDELWQRAMARFINDTAWFLLPLKLFDPSATLVHEGAVERDGQTFQVLRLAFEGGFSGRKYRLFVDSGFRIRRWEMTPRGHEQSQVGMTWETYRPVGPLLLAHEHKMDNGRHRVRFEDTVALHHVRHEELLPAPAR